MNDYQKGIIEEVRHYIQDRTYSYALMLDGEWGIGKTYFIKSVLIPALNASIDSLKISEVKYISLYGCSTNEDVRNLIYSVIVDDEIDSIVSKAQDGKIFDKEKQKQKTLIHNTVSVVKNAVSFALQQKGINVSDLKVRLSDIVGYFKPLDEYLFIFDDLERCKCRIDELFGFINELLEHENAKLIIVANEKELHRETCNMERALEYIAASDSRIHIKESRDNIFLPDNKAKNEETFTEKRLKERADILFHDNRNVPHYLNVREKIIGHTIFFMPDLTGTMHQIIEGTIGSSELNEVLSSQVGNYRKYMEHYDHSNFRTFQFFLSKANFLYIHYAHMKIPENKKKQLLKEIVFQCFIASLIYKAELHDRISDIHNDMQYPLKISIPYIVGYVEKGIYSLEEAKRDLSNFMGANMPDMIASDDPVNLLRNEYYRHDEEWVDRQYLEMISNLEKNLYPSSFYVSILQIAVNLTSVGFDIKRFDRIKEIMTDAAESNENISQLVEYPYFSNESKEGRMLKEAIAELNGLIGGKNTKKEQRELEEILHLNDWIEEMKKFIRNELKESIRKPLFNRVSSELWIKKFLDATPDDIFQFRILLAEYYPNNVIYDAMKSDRTAIAKIAGSLTAKIKDEQMDKILRQNLKWLINDFRERCSF